MSFPEMPIEKSLDDEGKVAYLFQTEGYGFMVGVAPDAIEDYANYLIASDSEQVVKALQTMEGVANGLINSGNQHLISMKSFRSGENSGLDVEYATHDPSNPDSRKRYSTLLLLKNTLYIFNCWYLDDIDHEADKEKFFKSILLKE